MRSRKASKAAAAQPASQSVDLFPLSVRAEVQNINDDTRTVDVVFSTGADVERYDWWTGKRYIERLSMKPEHVRLDRLNAGGPVLDAHSSYSITDQIGVVESAKVVAKEGRASLRFSKRDSVTPIWGDIRDKVIRNVSVGYRVHKFEEETNGNKLPIRTAIDWEPYEISMVPMPADMGAQVRSGDKSNTNPCVILTRDVPRETTMAEETRSEVIAE
jgi:hypothetical protein